MKKLLPFALALLSATLCQATAPFQFLSPRPNAKNITVNHNIVIRHGELLNVSTVRVPQFSITGSKSGSHDFTIQVSADQRTINLNPATPFHYDETVTVAIHAGLLTSDNKEIQEYQFSFATHREFTQAEKENFTLARSVLQQQEIERWSAMPPSVEADTREVAEMFEIATNNNPAPGIVLLDAFSGWGIPTKWTGYTAITNDGDSIYQNRMGFADDFKQLRNGYFGVYNGDYGRFDMLDSNFNLIEKYYPANGYYADNHEFQVIEDGHTFIIAQEYLTVDMTVYDPDYSPYATVFGTVIQEFDENKTLVFEWRSFDHVDILEAWHENLAASYIDFMHTNALEIDNDGHILASHRHLDQITKIDRNTGEFIWRLGGMMNEFTFIDDPEKFSYQHDIRRIANGNITLFDNGNYNPSGYSSAKEYELDEVNKTATLVWSYSRANNNGGYLLYFAMGSVQRLSNGNSFINWGWRGNAENPSITEVTPDGEIVWELYLTSNKNMVAYRSHKYDYTACARPTFQKMRSVNVTSNSATLKWTPAYNAESFLLEYKLANESTWTQKAVTNTSKTITGLQSGSVYEWRLKTNCSEDGSVTSGYTQSKKFTTLPLKQSSEAASPVIYVYPNPAAEKIYVATKANPVQQYRLMDMLGHELLNERRSDSSAGIFSIALDQLPAGQYLLELVMEAGSSTKLISVE
jgi:hypothetical protein